MVAAKFESSCGRNTGILIQCTVKARLVEVEGVLKRKGNDEWLRGIAIRGITR